LTIDHPSIFSITQVPIYVLLESRNQKNKDEELTMNHDILKSLNLKYELIDNYKSFDYYDDNGNHHIELYLLDELLRLCHRCNSNLVDMYTYRIVLS